MRNCLIVITVLLPFFANAQSQRQDDIFPGFGNFERRGWLISPSVNYTLHPFKNSSQRLFINGDSVYDIAYNAVGKIGLGFEIGRFQAIDNSRLISYIDFSIGLKVLNGAESFEAVRDVSDGASPNTLLGEGKFSHSYITASFNATHAKSLSKTISIQNSVGVNGDYRMADSFNYEGDNLPLNLADPGRLLIQAHYKLGFGFMMSKNILVTPSIETPILTFYEYDDLKSTLEVFHSRYRPLIFRVTIMMLDNKPDRKCPKKKKSRKNSESLFGSKGGKSPW